MRLYAFIVLAAIIVACAPVQGNRVPNAPNNSPAAPETPTLCAKEGEQYSAVYDGYPRECCAGLTAWESGFDTRISVEGTCYETGLLAGSPVGTCLACGDGICAEQEDVCNCAQDCPGKSEFTMAGFCEQAGTYCGEGAPDEMKLLCGRCGG